MPALPSPALSDEAINHALAPFNVVSSAALAESIRKYIDLLLLWNEKVNLTSITDPREMLARHFGESLFAASAVPISAGRLADVGSGAGFPGLALKLLIPDLEVFLVESVMKKATFLLEVVRQLNLTGVKVVVSRFEDLRDTLAPLDFICARALGDYGQLLDWARYNLNISGKVVLWLGADEAKRISAPPEWTWRESVPIPGSLRRCLLISSARD
ncbi:MAG TPA: 16S rRNA (guanine(527)-N(7))-methyltransferase RsmG [Candidatus Acidoferrales bacterium]|nr:16S rRNA (guanine(527)-N(7))-methyltransferase RsmG [Candidatus Acidoferrales bacterium]